MPSHASTHALTAKSLYVASISGTVGWEAVQGALVAARHYALGDVAVAQHVNDAAARAVMNQSLFFQFTRQAMKYAVLLNIFWFLPLLLLWRKSWQMQRREGTA